MRILWVVNTPIGPIGEKLNGSRANGLWMDALLDSFNGAEAELNVATAMRIKETVCFEETGVRYYALPDSVPLLYNEDKQTNVNAWKRLISDIKPDLIQIFGTEFTHGLCALRAAGNIPSVVYMQGYLGSIARHYLAGMTERELRCSVTVRDAVKRDSIKQQQKKYARSAAKEKEMLERAGRIISENEWCNASVRSVVPDIKIYNCPLSVNQVFSKVIWDTSKAERHSIICNASGYPLKGLHTMLRAVGLLKKKYPDIRLYVPGDKVISDGSLQWKLRKRGYTKFIEGLIRDIGILENIIWLGSLDQEELAKAYTKARVFVLCSAIENHSSSLKEAMMVGVPCVASAVGGIPEYVRHGENGFLYRFEEYEIMADYIEKIFNDDELAENLSKKGRKDMLKLHNSNDIGARMIEAYEDILSGKQ